MLRSIFVVASVFALVVVGFNSDAQNEHYVFVEGLFNEGTPGQFYTEINYLKNNGVDELHIHRVHPRSPLYFTSSAVETGRMIFQAAYESPEGFENSQMILVGHSRGALEVMVFALSNPDFVRDHVKSMILMQGPFGGSRIADYLMGQAEGIDPSVPWDSRLHFRLLSLLGAGATPFIQDGLYSLTTSFAQNFWPAFLSTHQAAIPIVSPKTKYLVGSQSPGKDISFVLKGLAWYMQKSVGDNDGMVALADQSLTGVGKVVGHFNADHADLVLPGPLSNGDYQEREKIARFILLNAEEN
jgi:pimeloyl-ACP methyl ester carboxylesterase